MKINQKIAKRMSLMLMLFVLGVAQSWAADYTCWTQAIYKMALRGTSAPSYEAGVIYVSTELVTDESQIEAVAEEITTSPLYHYGPAASCKQDYYYYVKANPGYEFLGWGSTQPTSASWKASGAYVVNEANKVGDYYWYKGTTSSPYSSNTEEKPTKLTRYAVFDKQEGEPTGNDGVAFKSATPTSFAQGSSTNFNISVFFDADIDFKVGDSKLGVNDAVVKYVTVTSSTGDKVEVKNVSCSATYTNTAEEGAPVVYVYSNGHGVIQVPGTLAEGEYSVHIPYSLFKTVDGGVSAACDFTFTVTPDQTPIALASSSPEDNGTWDADPESETADGTSVTITLNFDKAIETVVEGKTITLMKGERAFECLKYSKPGIQSTAAAKQLIIQYGELPNGEYVATIPAGVVKGANGVGNEEIVLHFTVAGSLTPEWKLPEYTTVTPSISNNSVVRSATSVEWTLSREGYDDPVGIVPNAEAVKASLIVTTFDPENTDPEYTGTQEENPVSGVTASVKGGKLVVTFTKPVAEAGKLVISVPAGIVNNLAMPIATMTDQEIFEEGGCTNPALSLTLNIEPVDIECVRVTNARPLSQDFVFDENGGLTKDKYGNYAKTYVWQDLKDAELVADVDNLSYIYFWYSEDFANINYTGGATIKNLSNGKELGVGAIEFKTGNSGDGHKYDVIEFRISSEDYLKFENQQGLYEVTLPAGIATTADGMKNAAYTFQFKYGDPANAVIEEPVDLDSYVGSYKMHIEAGEVVTTLESFDFVKDGETYYLQNINGYDIKVPIAAAGGTNKFVAKATGNDNYFFGTMRGADVEVKFQENGGKNCIYVDQYIIQDINASSYNVYGLCIYEQQPEPVSELEAYLGAWNVAAEDDAMTPCTLSFTIEKIDGVYYAHGWDISSNAANKPAKVKKAAENDLLVPVTAADGVAVFKYTTNDTTGAIFRGSEANGDAKAVLGTNTVTFNGEVMVSLDGDAGYYINANTAAERPTPTGIDSINAENAQGTVIYNIAGQRMSAAKGLVIINGKKQFVK